MNFRQSAWGKYPAGRLLSLLNLVAQGQAEYMQECFYLCAPPKSLENYWQNAGGSAWPFLCSSPLYQAPFWGGPLSLSQVTAPPASSGLSPRWSSLWSFVTASPLV